MVYNNVLARLRRLSPNLDEAAADLGADGFQAFRYVTFPLIRSALFAGALLAFALSFDEIVVTTFTAGVGIETLPQWIFNNIVRPNQVPIVNVVAVFVIVLSSSRSGSPNVSPTPPRASPAAESEVSERRRGSGPRRTGSGAWSTARR